MLVAIDVRLTAAKPASKEPLVWHLALSVSRREVPREAAGDGEPLGLIPRRMLAAIGCPTEHELGGERAAMTGVLREPYEVAQDDLVRFQPKSQRPAVLKVFLHALAQRASARRCHRRAPGHGIATSVSDRMSTFA